MCGIVGYIGTKKAVPVLINGLKSLEYRGYDSAGVAVLNKSEADFQKRDYEIKVVKDKGRVKNIEDKQELEGLLDATIGIAHTRWATHGEPSELNAHPHLDNHSLFAVVHNGIIENYNELRSFLLEKGYNLKSQTDTEVIPNLIHYYFFKSALAKGNTSISKYIKQEPLAMLKAVNKAIKDLKGSYAISVISPLFPKKIVVAKKDSPLVIGKGEGENFIASDIPAILNFTNTFYFLDEMEMAEIDANKVTFYNINLKQIDKPLKSIEWDAVASEKQGYADFMLKEIYEQPKAIRETIGSKFNSENDINLDIDLDFTKFNKIYIVACGTAMHAGLATKYSFEHFCKINTEVDVASEFRYRDPLVNDKTICIFISQSGETADTIAALKLAKEKGSKTIAIVNVIDSSITRVADYTLYTHAGPEIAVASTKAYTAQVTLLSILSAYIAEKLNIKEVADELKELKKDIAELPQKVEETLKVADQIKDFSQKVFDEKDIFFIGRGTDYTVSMEGSLKLKEISYIHSEGYQAGELKHGPIALIEDNVTVIGVATVPGIISKTVSNLEEVQTRGAKILLVTNDSIPESEYKNIKDNEKNTIVITPTTSSYLSPVLSVIPLQILAYNIAKAKSLDVDKPRNLAKSVTVE